MLIFCLNRCPLLTDMHMNGNDNGRSGIRLVLIFLAVLVQRSNQLWVLIRFKGMTEVTWQLEHNFRWLKAVYSILTILSSLCKLVNGDSYTKSLFWLSENLDMLEGYCL